MEALCITPLSNSVSFVDELQLLNKRTKSVDLGVYTSNYRYPYNKALQVWRGWLDAFRNYW